MESAIIDRGVDQNVVVPASETPAPGAISSEQLEAIAAGRRRGRKIIRAATMAAISGWTMAFFAAVSVVGGLFSLSALFLGLGLAVVAFIEVRGSRALLAFDLSAPRRLACNQIAVAAVVIMYAGWQLALGLFGPGAYDEHIAAGGPLAETLEPIDRLTRTITVLFYALVIVGSLVAQGLGALYYFTRRAHMVAWLQHTPSWVVEVIGGGRRPPKNSGATRIE